MPLPIRTLSLLLLLSAAGCQQARQVSDFFSGRTPIRDATMMEDADFPDRRRVGINNLARRSFARKEPYTDRYRQIAAGDEDHLVRAAAIRALNVSRDVSASSLFVEALGDEHPLVRLEAAKALGNMLEPTAVDPLVRIVRSDPDIDVRIAAAAALKYYKELEVARALIPLLNEQDFGVAWQARRSLRRLTGQDLQYDEAAWLALITGPDNPFS